MVVHTCSFSIWKPEDQEFKTYCHGHVVMFEASLGGHRWPGLHLTLFQDGGWGTGGNEKHPLLLRKCLFWHTVPQVQCITAGKLRQQGQEAGGQFHPRSGVVTPGPWHSVHSLLFMLSRAPGPRNRTIHTWSRSSGLNSST